MRVWRSCYGGTSCEELFCVKELGELVSKQVWFDKVRGKRGLELERLEWPVLVERGEEARALFGEVGHGDLALVAVAVLEWLTDAFESLGWRCDGHDQPAMSSRTCQVSVPAAHLPTRRPHKAQHAPAQASTNPRQNLGLCSTIAH